MKLTPEERQTLLGPLVVGIFLGAFVAYAVVAFDSESRLSGIAVSAAQTLLDAAFGFTLSVAATVGLLGALPVAVRRLLSTVGNDQKPKR